MQPSFVEHTGIEPVLPHCKCRVNTQRMPQVAMRPTPQHSVEDLKPKPIFLTKPPKRLSHGDRDGTRTRLNA